MPDRVSQSQQENLLTLLCWDDQNGKIIANAVKADLFEGDYYTIANRAIDFHLRYGKAPREHIADLLSDILEGENTRRARFMGDLLQAIYDNSSAINATYVMSQLRKFVRQQRMKTALVEAADTIQSGREDCVDEAEVILQTAMRDRLELFDRGLQLTDVDRSLAFLTDQVESFPTGIKELDLRGLGPVRQELHLFIALPKRGKTWWMVNLAKQALLHRLRVCHVTLEMSEVRMAQRYFQALFAMAKRDGKYFKTEFVLDELDNVCGLEHVATKPVLRMDMRDIGKRLRKRIDQWGLRFKRLVIKQFPTSSLTVPELKAYLDMLEQADNFIPDLLIIDYPDLMRINSQVYRHDLGRIYKELRGLAVERNIAVAIASQSNRSGKDKKVINESNVAEDFSKIATVDCAITYNQTDEEAQLGLARLYVANGRNDEDRFTILINQQYATGQFVFESARMVNQYWDHLSLAVPPEDDI